MSKLIVEMEMPRNCQECPLSHALYLRGSMYCGANGISYEKEHYKLKRPDQCPIVGVLPDEHGDLIDRDVAIKTFKCIEEAPFSIFDGQESFYAPEDVVNTLLCQDVLIAAERKDDGTTAD